MKLIADSGSTKTDWVVRHGCGADVVKVSTEGINPYHLDDDQIKSVLESQLIPMLSDNNIGVDSIDEVRFYGAGCSEAMRPRMESLLKSCFLNAEVVEARSDMLGAARALLGNDRGVACILGTGSNSCYYDGQDIAFGVSPMGYILGDEGSGAVMGRDFINAMYRCTFPEEIQRSFESETCYDQSVIINKVYREPMANRFLASLAPFIHDYLHIAEVEQFVIGHFERFFNNVISQYVTYLGTREFKIHFVGSIAYHFESQLRTASNNTGFSVGKILKTPL